MWRVSGQKEQWKLITDQKFINMLFFRRKLNKNTMCAIIVIQSDSVQKKVDRAEEVANI